MDNVIDADTDRRDILQILGTQKPLFQLKSGESGLKSSEAFFDAGGQSTAQFHRASYASNTEVLHFLATNIKPGDRTLETGAGYSTCVMVASGARHTAVNPDVTANGMIREFLRKNGLDDTGLTFLEQPSDIALPHAPLEGLKLALIDGNHSFPHPIIDWHYIDKALAPGGLLLVDDAAINAVGVLIEFLRREPSYEHIQTIGDTVVFRRTNAPRASGWGDQQFNRASVRIGKSLSLSILRKARRKLTGQR